MEQTFDFKKLKDEKAEAKVEAEKKKNQPKFDFVPEDIHWAPLIDKKERVLRPVGAPWEYRTQPWHTKFVYHSEIVTDDGKSYIKLNWPQKTTVLPSGFIQETGELDEDWLLMKVFKAIQKREWENFPKGVVENGKTGKWNYLYADKPVFKRVEENRKVGDKFPPRFYPGKRVLIPVIDRQDDFCTVNNSVKVMSSAQKFWKNDEKTQDPIFFTDLGIPGSLYDAIVEHVGRFRSSWETEDLVITKEADKKGYDIRDASDVKYITEESQKVSSLNPLTEEERAYAKPNLDRAYQYTSYNKLLKKVPNLFKEVDAACGTNFYDLLVYHADQESKARAEKTAAQPEATDEAAPAEPVKESAPARRAAPSGITSVEQFPKFGSLSAEDQATLRNAVAGFENGKPTFKSGASPLPCSNEACTHADGSPTMWPEEVMSCAICGAKYA